MALNNDNNEDLKLKETKQFKHLLEYFVTHLEYIRTGDKNLPGYKEYLRRWIDGGSFAKAGQGYNGNRIQNQIAQWESLSKGTVHISVYGPDCTGAGSYLQWDFIAQNVRAKWNEDKTRIESLQVVENAKEPDEILIADKTVEELGLFDGKDPNEVLQGFYDEFALLHDKHYEEI